MLYDIAIVGAGPAGTAAALALKGSGLKICVIDGGFDAPKVKIAKTFDEVLQKPEEHRNKLLGENYEYLKNIVGEDSNPKLSAPLQSYVSQGTNLLPLKGEGFSSSISLAMGGLANVWGAQMIRYNANDLNDFPLSQGVLNKHYDALSKEMGISGAHDDLTAFYGEDENLQPPLKLNPNAEVLVKRYSRHKAALNKAGFFMGHPRAAILTQDKDGRSAHKYDGLEFYNPRNPAIYTPAYTLQKLIQDGSVEYKPRHLVKKFEEEGKEVRLVTARINHDTQQEEIITARRVLLGAGTLNSARIVLASVGKKDTRLPIMDNPVSYMALINPRRLGQTQDKKTGYLQANICYQPQGEFLSMGALYAIRGLLSSDFLTDLPIPINDAIRLLPHILPGMLVLQLWHPEKIDTSRNYMTLAEDGTLHITYSKPQKTGREMALIKHFRKLGYFTAHSLVKYPLPGSSFHNAGALPMREKPGAFETDLEGRLGGTGRVHVIDGSVFPALPAKNLSYTIMANAHRVATNLKGAFT